MRKILICCGIALLLSCSNDSEVKKETDNINAALNVQSKSSTSNEDGEPEIEDDIDQLFYDYKNSIEFFNAENAHKTFFSKLKYTGDYENIKTHSKLILWIESNIAITEFPSVNEAITELNNLINLEKIKEERFVVLFDFIKTAPIDEVVSRFSKWFPANIMETSGSKCDKIFKECMDGVSTQYQLEIRTNYASDCTTEEKLAANVVSKQNYQDGMSDCRKAWAV